MFENIIKFFKKLVKAESRDNNSKETAKERLHLVLMQDRANVSADFLDMMKQEIIEVIKKYIDVDENAIDVRLTNKANDDGTNGAPALYANIPIISIKEDVKRLDIKEQKEQDEEKEKKINEEAKKIVEQESKKEDKEEDKIEENKEKNENEIKEKEDVEKEETIEDMQNEIEQKSNE